jgi:hypothetical protein
MTNADWTAADVDLTVPSAARMYDFNLGGSHNFAVDRNFAQEMNNAMPDLPMVHRANRALLHRVVRFLTGVGIRQFLDLGSGIPTVGNVHEAAQTADPEARVVYVDVDPVAVIHSNTILANNDRAAAIRADVRDASGILANPTVRSLIDFTQPVGTLMFTVLHYISDDDHPLDIVRTFRDAMCPGSYLAISHGTAEGKSRDQSKAGVRVGSRNKIDSTMRGRAEVLQMFEGFDIVEPGVVFSPEWRPDSPRDPLCDDPERSAALAAVGVKR